MMAATTELTSVATFRNVAALVSRVWDVRVSGSEHVPVTGAVILAANHMGVLDGPLLVARAPRPLRLLAKSSLFATAARPLLRISGQLPIDYEGPDRSALLVVLGLLQADHAVGIFPEAHRGRGDAARVRHGVAYLAARSGAPVVPVAVLGTRAGGASYGTLPGPRSRVEIAFGEPVRHDAVPWRSRRAVAEAGETLRQVLADHVAETCRVTGHTLPAPPAGTS